MPQHKDAKKRRRTFFARIPSTFTNKLSSVCSITDDKKMLHSKSTYFYRWGSRKKLSSKMTFLIPSVCGLALLVGGIVAINPATGNTEKAFANEPAEQSSDFSIGLEIEGGTIKETPALAGEIQYRSDVVRITSNNLTHYAVALNTAIGNTGELIGREHKYAIVNKVQANTAPPDFPENTWGYALSKRNDLAVNENDMIFNPIPSGESGKNSVTIAESVSRLGEAIDDSYKLVFAAKLGNDLPPDHYEANVYLSVVADAKLVATFVKDGREITAMREMDSDTCSNAAIGTTTQLLDDRIDASGEPQNKKYWVTKLRDGNCWMTQNLDFDIPNILASDTSDVLSSVSMGNTKINSIANWTNESNSFTGYYDPGDYIYVYQDHSQAPDSSCTGVTDLASSNCQEYFRLKDSTTTAEDMHYHLGNYYSWNAATAKSGGGINTIAPQSICPKGWHLPVYSSSTSGSFHYMFNKYDLNSVGVSTSSGLNAYEDPLYFVYGGYVGGYVDTTKSMGKLNRAGADGLYWTSYMTSTDSCAHDLIVSNTGHRYCSNRYAGESIRCVFTP